MASTVKNNGADSTRTTRRRTSSKAAKVAVEPLVAEWLEKVTIDPKIQRSVKTGLPLADGTGECSPEALQLLIELCSCPGKNAYFSAHASDEDYELLSYIDKNDPESDALIADCGLYKPEGTGDVIKEIASWFDREVLSSRLEEIFFDRSLNLALVALARYGNDAAIKRLVALIDEWDYKGGLAPKYISIARGALIYNDAREAMKYLDDARLLGVSAEVRGIDPNVLYDMLTAPSSGGQYGFDKDSENSEMQRADSNGSIYEEGPVTHIEPFVAELLRCVEIAPKIGAQIHEGVALADGEVQSSPEALQLLVQLCSNPLEEARTGRHHAVQSDLCRFLNEKYELGKTISELGALFEQKALSRRLEQLFYDQQMSEALIALCRFGTNESIKRIVESMRDREYGVGMATNS